MFNVRFNDRWTPETLQAEISRRVAGAAADARTTLTFDPTNAVSFLTARGAFTDLVAAAVEDVTGRRPELVDQRGNFGRALPQGRPARWSTSGCRTPPFTPSMSAWRSTTWKG